MRIIMVPVANRPESVSAMKSAMQLAAKLGAIVQACHIRPHRDSTVFIPPESPFALPQKTMEKIMRDAKVSEKKLAEATRTMVAELAEKQGLKLVKRVSGKTPASVVWSEKVGYTQHLMQVTGPFSDLIVVSRPATKKSATAREFVRSALLDTSRPVLILPPGTSKSIGQRVVIAWDRTQNAMQAVVCALPILQHAESVSIITSGAGKGDGPPPRSLVNYLKTWGIKSTLTQTRGVRADAVKDIGRALEKSKADLLVMGSFSRSRLRERIFGGVTQHMLDHLRCPTLTVHTS